MLYVNREMQEYIEEACYWTWYEREHEARRAAEILCRRIEALADAQVDKYLASHRANELKTQERAEDFACRYAERMARAWAGAIRDGYRASKAITKPHTARLATKGHTARDYARKWDKVYTVSPALVREWWTYHPGATMHDAWMAAREWCHASEDVFSAIKDASDNSAEIIEPRAVLVNRIRAICPRASLSHGGEWKPRASSKGGGKTARATERAERARVQAERAAAEAEKAAKRDERQRAALERGEVERYQ